MIITCEKCSKTFKIQDNLIPDEGRLLQCGSCNHKWLFQVKKKVINLENEDNHKSTLVNDYEIEKIKKTETKNKVQNENTDIKISKNNKAKPSKKSSKIFKNSLVVIISFIALIFFLDTFKYQLNNYIPELNLILNNLYETLKDLFLFFNDLIN